MYLEKKKMFNYMINSEKLAVEIFVVKHNLIMFSSGVMPLQYDMDVIGAVYFGNKLKF